MCGAKLTLVNFLSKDFSHSSINGKSPPLEYDAQLLHLVEVISDDDSSDEDDHPLEGWLNDEWLI